MGGAGEPPPNLDYWSITAISPPTKSPPFSRMLKNYHQMIIQSILKDQECLKSPFGKGGNKNGF
jgi:hypothetical protein